MSAREVLRDALLERQGEAPEAETYELLREAIELQRPDSTETGPVRELAEAIVEEAGVAECLRATFPGFRRK